jgi:hypothetical protein
MALREKQIQQNFRPYIGVHKWFARRPGTLFRNLLLSEFRDDGEPVSSSYFRAHSFGGTIADPFMGGGTPLLEANRLGFDVVGADVNPMAWWIVRQELAPLDDEKFASTAAEVAADVERDVGHLYRTTCVECGEQADAKYFLWVKVQDCPECGAENDLFPGYRLAEAERHPKHVLACPEPGCGVLSEHERLPTESEPAACPGCGGAVYKEGPAGRGTVGCRSCGHRFRYPAPNGELPDCPPEHRMWAVEYHCGRCKEERRGRKGRFFKAPDVEDLRRVETAASMLAELEATDAVGIPDEEVPDGDETGRLRRWGYRRWRDLFGVRQLLGLGLLLARIRRVEDDGVRHALLTVFSDFLRYQNMLCRYDTYALKCQDIFAVHGFPVGLVQCENSLLGVPKVGAGAFRHFVEKYRRAKNYCREPFEKVREGKKNVVVPIEGERIEAVPVAEIPCREPRADGAENQDAEDADEEPAEGRRAFLQCAPSAGLPLDPESIDGVFTDPPYFDNVQYAELMDFCYVWLRRALAEEFAEFERPSTQDPGDLTGNRTLGRGLEHFADGLSEVFSAYARALKPGAPFIFTYHHNDPEAYAPVVLAVLDAGLACEAVLPAPGEMEASLHIHGTGSSVLDSVFVCRPGGEAVGTAQDSSDREDELGLEAFEWSLLSDLREVARGGVSVSLGDARCLFSGHVARLAIRQLGLVWDRDAGLDERLARVRAELSDLTGRYGGVGTAGTNGVGPGRPPTAERLLGLLKPGEPDQAVLFGPEEVSVAQAIRG